MLIQKYGITLKRIDVSHIETLRRWRNDEKISQHMVWRGYITPDMQNQWFKGLDEQKDFYFMITYQNHEVGMINLKDVNHQMKYCESGIYIYDEQNSAPFVSIAAAILLFDFAFYDLELECMRATVLASNQRAIRYNESFGYKVVSRTNIDGIEVLNYALTRKDYSRKEQPFKKYLARF